MQIDFVEICTSTQSLVINALKNGKTPPFGVFARLQTAGVGSRGNEWQGGDGNLYFSFCVAKSLLPKDLSISSSSIYFAMIMKEILLEYGSKVWLKWPNDFYIDDKKIGGVITNKIGSNLVCGMGINLVSSPQFADILDIDITPKKLVDEYVKRLKNNISWKQIFSKFMIDFEKSKKFYSHIGDEMINLDDARLCEDGAILINKKKVYSLR
ncbi:MAG: biotin--[acetyl-CoA-carboxylase] ligase [Campylobacter sp.]|nr:biotin--[acetyl-CoA-carboxylase] ligase [Campylobacter sp.]